jgi:hypothetical protein
MSAEATVTNTSATPSSSPKQNPANDGDSRRRSEDEALEPRQRTLNAYLQQADETLDPLQANLAYLTGDLLLLFRCYCEDLELVRAEISDPKVRLEWMHVGTEEASKLSKQILALAQTTMRLDRARQPPPSDEGAGRFPRYPR